MLDIGWTELLIIGVVALIVVGPKDLPKMFRTLGQLTGKARSMAREFQRAMDAAADEAGVKDMARDFRDVASGRKFKDELGLDELDREMRDMGRPDQWGNEGAGKKPETVAQRAARERAERAAIKAEADGDEAIAAEHDADMGARNAKMSALDAERMKAADRAAAARQKAADIRARRDAEAATRGAGTPAQATPATGAEPAVPPGAAQTRPRKRKAKARDDASGPEAET